MSKKKKQIKRVTRENFYRPKNKKKYRSPYVFKRFINNFADKKDWGLNKKHFHFDKYISSKDRTNAFIISEDPRYWNLNQMKVRDIERHLLNRRYIYYTNSQLSHTPLFCLDIDLHDWTSQTDIEKVKELLLSLHPNCYFEHSSRGKGLHFYLLMDFTEYSIDPEELNTTMQNYSNILKLYINTFFSAKYDDLKATYAKYEYNSQYQRYLLHTCGMLCKLPCPESDADYDRLYNIPLVTIDQVESNVRYITSILESLFSYILDGGTGLGLFINIDDICTFMEDRHLFSKDSSFVDTTPSLSYCNSVCAQSVQQKKYEKNISEIRTNTNAFERAKSYYKLFFRQYYRTNNIFPAQEICRAEYRKDVGTDDETAVSRKRLDEVYEYTLKTFDKTKVKKSDYEFGEYLDHIEKIISSEQLDVLRKNCTNYRSQIYPYDIDITLGYIFKSLCNQHPGYEPLSLPVIGLEKWYQIIIEQERSKGNLQRINGCNSHKRTALFILVQKLGYLLCFDDNYNTGKARRYLLTERFPKYAEFVKAVGQDTLNAVQNARDRFCAVQELDAA